METIPVGTLDVSTYFAGFEPLMDFGLFGV